MGSIQILKDGDAASRDGWRGPETVLACKVLGLDVRFVAPVGCIAEALQAVYGAMRRSDASECAASQNDGVAPELVVQIRPIAPASPRVEVSVDEQPPFEVERLGDLLHQLDNFLTITLERRLPQLYFVHAAALVDRGSTTLLVGASGAGKSTLAYALASAGLSYLSDELAPIVPESGLVLPYPRAICLKRDPPAPLAVPSSALRTEWTLHLRATDLGAALEPEGAPLARIAFVHYSPDWQRPELRRLSPGEASLRLYESALNPLAHPSLGLDDTLGLVQRAECFELRTAAILETVACLREAAQDRR